jgi:tRNA pseudouridine55 synthase
MESNICVLVNKPIGLSSRDVSYVIRRELELQKVGHLGTLDVEASGLLIVMSGACTKLERFLHKLEKTYEGEIVLGKKYSTDDIYGEILKELPIPNLNQEILNELKVKFTGEILQIPPQVSAKKVNGKTAYKEVRAGKEVELEAKRVSVEIVELLLTEEHLIRYKVTCSSGFYVRSFARDLGKALGTYGATKSINRTRVGTFSVDEGIVVLADKSIETRRPESIISLDSISKLIPLPVLEILDEEIYKKIILGNKQTLNTYLENSIDGEYCLRFQDRLASIVNKSRDGASFLVNF